MRCMAHIIINLAVQVLLRELKAEAPKDEPSPDDGDSTTNSNNDAASATQPPSPSSCIAKLRRFVIKVRRSSPYRRILEESCAEHAAFRRRSSSSRHTHTLELHLCHDQARMRASRATAQDGRDQTRSPQPEQRRVGACRGCRPRSWHLRRGHSDAVWHQLPNAERSRAHLQPALQRARGLWGCVRRQREGRHPWTVESPDTKHALKEAIQARRPMASSASTTGRSGPVWMRSQ